MTFYQEEEEEKRTEMQIPKIGLNWKFMENRGLVVRAALLLSFGQKSCSPGLGQSNVERPAMP